MRSVTAVRIVWDSCTSLNWALNLLSRNVNKHTFCHVSLTNTQISMRIGSVVFVCIKQFSILSYPKCAQFRFWSACANAQFDLIHERTQMSESTLSRVAEDARTYFFVFAALTKKKLDNVAHASQLLSILQTHSEKLVMRQNYTRLSGRLEQLWNVNLPSKFNTFLKYFTILVCGIDLAVKDIEIIAKVF